MLTGTTITWLKAQGFDPTDLNATAKYDDTPLIRACREGETVVAAELLQVGLPIRVRLDHRNMDGTDALWACVVSNSFDIADALLAAGANINNQNDNGATALMYAASSGKTDWVRYFLEKGADTSLRSLDDFSALDLASNIECLRLLKRPRAV